MFRGGYGIYFEPLGVPNEDVIQTGFSQTTQLVPTLDNGLTFTGTLANPFPNGFLLPAGAAGGLSTNLGQGVSFFNQDARNPYAQRWQFAVQRSLPFSSLFEVSYVGQSWRPHRVTRNLDAIPNQYLSTSPVRDQATINFLSAQVPNPFYPLLPGTSLSGTTVSRSQLLMPYPQFTSVNSTRARFLVRITRCRRALKSGSRPGFLSSVSYTWSKLMEARTYSNAGDPLPEKVISDQDRPHRIVITGIYELPFGRGKAFGGSWKGFGLRRISGWQVSGIYQGAERPCFGIRERSVQRKSERHSDSGQ